MPTIHVTPFPPDTPWQEFEKLTLHGMALKWESPNLQGEGRPGQDQDGVDIFGLDNLGRPVGIQCKKYNKPLKISQVKKEVALAENFQGAMLNCLYIATTAPHDVKLQREVRALSEERVKKCKFAVGLLYWDDIFTGLLLDQKILISHFPHLKFPAAPEGDTARKDCLSALMLGYYGRFLWKYIELAYGEFGWMAQQDPEEMRTVIRIVRENCNVASKEVAREISSWTKNIETELFEQKTKVDWLKVELLAKRVQGRVQFLSSLLNDAKIADCVEVGISIGHVNWAEGTFTENAAKNLAQKIYSILPAAKLTLPATLDRITDKECYQAAPVLFTFVDNEMRWSGAK